jgi:CrcB protein
MTASLSWFSVLAVAVGGALGALARYGAILGASGVGASPAWATLAVNIAGSLAAGAWLARVQSAGVAGDWHAFVAIGFLGALTTMSTLTVDFLLLLESRGFASALVAAGSQFGLCLLSAGLGHWFASSLLASPGGV